MDTPVVYADLNTPRTSRPKSVSPPSHSQGGCTFTRGHQLPLKVSFITALTLLILTVIGLSVSVKFLTQTSSSEKSSVDGQENRTAGTERPAPLKCPDGWLIHRNKCIFFSQTSNSWNESLHKCCTKESTFLLIQDKEELVELQKLDNIKGNLFWIGLNYTSEKGWMWTNGSVFNSDVLRVDGEAEERSCVVISKDKVIAEQCDSDNKWICQKDRKSV